VLTHSLPYIRKLGVENIVAHRQPMLQRLHEEMPRLGFTLLTPPESTSALVSSAVKDRRHPGRSSPSSSGARTTTHPVLDAGVDLLIPFMVSPMVNASIATLL
jgi:hypothetical protein